MARVKVEQLETGSPMVLTYEIADDAWDDLHWIYCFELYMRYTVNRHRLIFVESNFL